MQDLLKKLTAAVLIGVIGCFNAAADSVEDLPVPTEDCGYYACEENVCEDEKLDGCEKNFYNMGRGVANMATCWLEIPRCLIYNNSQLPVIGVVVGACEGVGFTVVRAFAGVADFCSFGFMTDSIYEVNYDFREFVWESRWVHRST